MIGSVIAGYRLEEPLGVPGGYGAAYRATRDGRDFVVKILHNYALNTERRARFGHEVKSLQRVNHPNVVRYVDHGRAPIGGVDHYYLVMPFEVGESLAAIVERGPLMPDTEIVELATQVTDALGAIHACNIVHRDLKPQNIFVRPSRGPLLLDFGIAKLIDYSSITDGIAPATWAYMAPEQPLDDVDGRADLYSLGAVMYDLLTGTPPFVFDGDFWGFLTKVKTAPPDLPSHRRPGISPTLESIVMKLLAKEPHERFQTAEALAAALRGLSSAVPTGGSLDTGVGPRFYLHVRNNQAQPLADALAGGATVSGVIYGASQLLTNRRPLGVAAQNHVPLVLDPETHRLARTDFSLTKGLVALPYARDSKTPIQPENLRSVDDYREFVGKVLGVEDGAQADIVLPPTSTSPICATTG